MVGELLEEEINSPVEEQKGIEKDVVETLEEKSVADIGAKSEELDYEKEKDLFDQLVIKNGGSSKKALFEYCYLRNTGYISKIADKIFKNPGPLDLPRVYLQAKEISKFAKMTFFEQIRQENFEKVYSEDYTVSLLDEEDKKNRIQVIEILGYDPFITDAPEDQPQLYRDLTGMLTEAMRKDIAKARAALSVVRGYSNLDKYQKRINDIMKTGAADAETQEQLAQLIKIQKTLQDSINQTAEKNNFTVKGIGNAGKGMLSDVMNQVQERGIDEGFTNFYDIATSRSIEEVANLSFKAQLNQVNLSKTDYADIIAGQAKIVKESQLRAEQAIEALRLAKEKIKKQELLEELRADYRRKGIKEEEIEEFIRREYKMYEIG